MNGFRLKKRTKLKDLTEKELLPESDLSLTDSNGDFLQFDYEKTDEFGLVAEPGVWIIAEDNSSKSISIKKTSYVEDNIYDEFNITAQVSKKIDLFFNKLDVYKKYGIEIPKRGILLYGPPGTGKTTVIRKVSGKYSKDNQTCVIIWPTDAFDAYEAKEFLKSLEFGSDVKKLILIVEDVGGIESDSIQAKSDSSLLSILDNQEKIFKLPILILATTNFPEVFLGNLTNRPQRFDDKIEVGFPEENARINLFKFFHGQGEIRESLISLIKSDLCREFSPAHIKECFLRAELYNKDLESVIMEISAEITQYKNAFAKARPKIGFGD